MEAIEKSQGDLNESRDRSLRLESVLEYTNRIKAFLGLQHEQQGTEEAKNPGNGFKTDVDATTYEVSLFDKNMNEDISMSENTASSYDELKNSTLNFQLLPDIVGILPDSLEEADHFPDILERREIYKIENLNFENYPKIITGKMNDPLADNDLQDLNAKVAESPEVTLCGKENFAKTEEKSDITANSVKEVSSLSNTKDEVDVSQDGVSDTLSKAEYDAVPSGQKSGHENDVEISRKIQNENDSDDENPYQITHIEEGLRQAEKSSKSTLPPEAHEPQAILKDGAEQDDPSASLKKRSMEDIRRLSTEVVHTVFQIAGDEVKVILQSQDDTSEENKPLNTMDVVESSLDDLEITQQNPEVEFKSNKLEILADIPEEEALQTFTSLISSTTSLKTIPPVGSKHSIDRIEVTDEIDFDLQCGFGPFKPRCIQSYATANVYVILYSIIGILHGSYYTYLVGVLTTLEKRFEFKSKTSGFIMMLDELTPLFLGVLVGHFGGRAHRPRLLSFGMFLSAFCCFASALPYFLYGTATHLSGSVHNVTSVDMCDGDVRLEHCDDDDRPPTLTAILLLMLGSFLKGFGNLAYYAIGLAYLDDNAKKRNTPLYFAVAFALRLLGPMLGFLMSSAFLKYYENPLVTPNFGPDDPRWIGGWWMGFVLQGILLLIFAGPMALFPRRLPDHRMHEMELNSNSLFEGLGDSLKRLVRNPLYMLIGLNAIFTVYGNFGYYIMLPKYMENQFRLSASSASLFAGPPGIAALMVSCIIGGYLIWKFKPSAKFLAGGLVTLELISTLGYLILMIPRCDKIEMTHFGMRAEGSFILESECNLNCSCSTVSFTPVCGGGTSYFSPCYAGCSVHKDQSFTNCSCLAEDARLTEGFCYSRDCWSQALVYIVTLPVLQFVVNILRVAYTMIMLRSIEPEDKNIALGVFETVLSTIAFIPFPVLFGTLVDSACLVWEQSCGETGNCWFYDTSKFNYLMHGGSAFFCSLSTLTLIAIFFLVPRIKDLYNDEEISREKVFV